MFELLEDYYPAQATGFIVCDQDGPRPRDGAGRLRADGVRGARPDGPRRRRGARALRPLAGRDRARMGRAAARAASCRCAPTPGSRRTWSPTSSPPTTTTAGCSWRSRPPSAGRRLARSGPWSGSTRLDGHRSARTQSSQRGPPRVADAPAVPDQQVRRTAPSPRAARAASGRARSSPDPPAG